MDNFMPISAAGDWALNHDFSKNLSLIFHTGGEEVLRITPEGDLVFANPSEAAQALREAWDANRGAIVGAPADPEAFG